MLLVSCIPAETPPQLNATPGAAVVVTGDLYESSIFSVRYPPGWRVITSPADVPPFVILAAPDNCALILVSSGAVDEPPTPSPCEQTDFHTETRAVTLGATTITAVGVVPPDQRDAFLPSFNTIVDSIHINP